MITNLLTYIPYYFNSKIINLREIANSILFLNGLYTIKIRNTNFNIIDLIFDKTNWYFVFVILVNYLLRELDHYHFRVFK